MIDIIFAQRACFDLLLKYQANHEGFYFAPRRTNKYNKLKRGYYLLGSDKYITISFWDGEDTLSRIHNIGFVILDSGKMYIELSARDDVETKKYLGELADYLNNNGMDFNEIKEGNWRHDFPSSDNYLEALISFIENEKLVIDRYLGSNPNSKIKMLTAAFNEKYVNKMILRLGVDIKEIRSKKTEAIYVSVTDHIKTFQHNELSNSIVEYLNGNGICQYS